MGCPCKKKNTNISPPTELLGEYTYDELEKVVSLITSKPRLTTEESDLVWELYNRIYYTDKLVNRRSKEQAGKVGRNLIKLYQYERQKTNGETEGSNETTHTTRVVRTNKKGGNRQNPK